MRASRSQLVFVFAFVCTAVATRPALAQVAPGRAVPVVGEAQFNRCVRLPSGRRVRVTLKPETEILDVIAWISGITCKGFISATGLSLAGRKVTVLSPDELTVAEAYRLFLALLDSVQLTVEPSGAFLRVIEASKSARALLPIRNGNEGDPALSSADNFVTRLLRVTHASVADIATVLQGYRSETGSIVAYPPAGTLIVTDRAAIVERLVALVTALDVPGEPMRLWTLPARHVSAVALAQTLADLVGAPVSLPSARGANRPAVTGATTASSGGIARMMPDERAARVLVVASDEAFARLAKLAARLDVPATTRAERVHAYRCRHADCDAVAAILSSLAGITVSRGPAPAGGRATPAAAMPAAQTSGAPAAAGAPLFAGDVRVTSDPSTNALLVMSSLDDFRTLRNLIEEIDVPRKQVFIEATILEVVRRKSRQLGVAFSGGRAVGSGGVVGGFNAGKTLL
ncbi:MAG TPA: secretin N-terminal domain-containing protein, partial [Polyangia bacterium]